MAYCDKCGAYIPDGQTVCLACGFDPKAEKESPASRSGGYADSGAAAQQFDWDSERQAREQERRIREEERRKKQEEYRRNAREEYDRRRTEEARARQSSDPYAGHPYSAQGQANRSRAQSRSDTRLFGVLSYLSFLFVLPFVFCPDDRYARFHAKQGLILFLYSLVSDFLASIVGYGWLLSLFRLYCIIKGISNAAAGKEEPLPIIGRLGQ